jgi:hypothetical protein
MDAALCEKIKEIGDDIAFPQKICLVSLKVGFVAYTPVELEVQRNRKYT